MTDLLFLLHLPALLLHVADGSQACWMTQWTPLTTHRVKNDIGWCNSTDTQLCFLQLIPEKSSTIPITQTWIATPYTLHYTGTTSPGINIIMSSKKPKEHEHERHWYSNLCGLRDCFSRRENLISWRPKCCKRSAACLRSWRAELSLMAFYWIFEHGWPLVCREQSQHRENLHPIKAGRITGGDKHVLLNRTRFRELSGHGQEAHNNFSYRCLKLQGVPFQKETQ